MQTPAPKKRSKQKNNKGTPSSLKGMALNNPYQNVPVKTNNSVPTSGFGFPGLIM